MTSQNLWQIVKPLVRQVQNEEAVLVVDDSIVHKPHTDENDPICWHYDHATEQTVKGINFVTALYCALPEDETKLAETKPADCIRPLCKRLSANFRNWNQEPYWPMRNISY